MTALHLAAREGHGSVATRLVQAGTALDVQDNSGQTALHHAGMVNDIKTRLLYLLSSSPPPPLPFTSLFSYPPTTPSTNELSA